MITENIWVRKIIFIDELLNNLESETEREYHRNQVEQALDRIEVGVFIFTNSGILIATNIVEEGIDVDLHAGMAFAIKEVSIGLTNNIGTWMKRYIYPKDNEEWMFVWHEMGEYTGCYTIPAGNTDEMIVINEQMTIVIDLINTIPV